MTIEVEIRKLSASVDMLVSRLDRFLSQPKPPMTVREFCKRANIGESTAYRMLKRREIRKENGRIPYEVARPFIES